MVKLPFRHDVANLLHATEGSTFYTSCVVWSGTCPVAEHMNWTRREIIAQIFSAMKDKVLESNFFWFCSSCYHCFVRCPRDIPIAGLMYALKRYSMWKGQYKEGMIGPGFSDRFVKTIVKTGKSFDPALAPAFLFRYGFCGFLLVSAAPKKASPDPVQNQETRVLPPDAPPDHPAGGTRVTTFAYYPGCSRESMAAASYEVSTMEVARELGIEF